MAGGDSERPTTPEWMLAIEERKVNLWQPPAHRSQQESRNAD